MEVSVRKTNKGKLITMQVLDSDDGVDISVKTKKGKTMNLYFETGDDIENVKFIFDDNANMGMRMGKMIQIFVGLISGKTVPLEVKRSDTAENVKGKLIQYMGSVSPYWYRLVHNGTYLKDSQTIENYNIQDESTLSLRLFMQIFVKVESGKTITLEVETSETIYKVKEKMKEKVNFPPNRYRLLYKGKQLEDVATLTHYKIQKESTLDMCMVQKYPSPPSPVYVKSVTGKTKTIDVHHLDTISSIKQKVQIKEGIPPDQQRLLVIRSNPPSR